MENPKIRSTEYRSIHFTDVWVYYASNIIEAMPFLKECDTVEEQTKLIKAILRGIHGGPIGLHSADRSLLKSVDYCGNTGIECLLVDDRLTIVST